MVTTKSVPPFPLEWRCKTCRLQQSHPSLFDELTLRLLHAEPRKDVVAWLKKQGISIDLKGLCVHYRRHVLPYWHEAVEIQQRLQIQAELLGQHDAGSIASALAMSLAMRAMDAVHEIDFARLGRKADPKLIDALTRLSEANAKIIALGADARLKEELVDLRAIDLALKRGELEQAAVRWLRYRLEEHPDIAAKVFALIEPIMPNMKALPAPQDETATPTPTSRRPQKRRAAR